MEDASVEPRVMPLDLLREITDGFSEERKLGSGSYGKVYKGVYQNGEKIAVKVLYDMPGLDDEQFQNEFKNLTRLRHQNIVRLVGYCHDIQEVPVQYEGKMVIAEKTHRALCLDYMSNGSLDRFLSDECDRYNWNTCYRIIKGICQGLKYLHNELKPPIYHLDLKPSNVLLDENMVPRIADFGISRLFSDEQTRSTKSLLGTLGYTPPEFIRGRLISNKFDIFSLGVVIIKMMAGSVGYYNSAEMSSQEFSYLVQENWTKRLHEASNLRTAYSEQVKICIEIGLSCVQEDRHKRPTIQDIVDRLNETVAECTYAARKDLLICQNSVGDITQPEKDTNTFPQYTQCPNDQHVQKIYNGSTSNQNIVASTHSNCYEENAGPTEARLDVDSRKYSADGGLLPGIEGFHIVGDPRPGYMLRACGIFVNGATLCHFQWVRWLEDGTGQFIEGATTHDYMVTADDFGAVLAVGCTPMDDNSRQGDLVMKFANNKNKITCDPDMLDDFKACISRGRADFDVYVRGYNSPDEWKKATLVLTRTRYQIYLWQKDHYANLFCEAVTDKKYSPSLQIKIPTGRSTQFVLVSSRGVNLPLNIQGIKEPDTEDTNVRQRDLIVLVMRTFQKRAIVHFTKLNATRISETERPLSTSSGEQLSVATPSPSSTNPTAEVSTFSSNKSWIRSLFKRKGKD